MEQIVKKEKKNSGYTTGTCAAAAAKAAAVFLISGTPINKVNVAMPNGKCVDVFIKDSFKKSGSAVCAVIKGLNYDHDITQGVAIRAKVQFRSQDIVVKGGPGIGIVTEPGLAVPVGEAAINPIPKKMIKENMSSTLNFFKINQGLEITISAPEGREIAQRTFNHKLGIIGGISILGTTGVVRPMSACSWKRSLLPQLDLASAAGYQSIVLTFGNLGERTAINVGFNARQIVQMSNFVGYMLKECHHRDIQEILLLGHLGKMIKVANGNFDTHSKINPQRLDLLVHLAKKKKLPVFVINDLNSCKSAEGALNILPGNARQLILNQIADMAARRASDYLDNKVSISAAITDLGGNIVGANDNAPMIIKKARKR